MPDDTLPARVPLAASGGAVMAIIPRDIDQMFRLANAMHISGLAPVTLKSPEQIMIAIMAGSELGLPPFQSVQSFAVVNGRPTLFGDGLIAVVRANGFRVREWQEGEGDGMIARCEVTRPDNGETASGEFSVSDAKKANLWGKAGPWQQYPKRMLKMRARAFALRDGAADVLRGFQLREEVEDYSDATETRATVVETPKASGLAARLADNSAKEPTQTTGFNAEHVAQETAPKASRSRRKASDAPTPNDTAQSAEVPSASTGAADEGDSGTGEIIDAEIEERPTPTASAQPADPGPASSDSATDASTDSAEATSGPSDIEKPSDDGSDDAPYTEMAEAITGAAHWLAIKQVLKGYAKSGAWKNSHFSETALRSAWQRFADLKNADEEVTQVQDDTLLFRLWLLYGARTAADIESRWPTFWRGAYKNAPKEEQDKLNQLRAERKAALE